MCNKILSFLFSCEDALKRLLFVVCVDAGYGGGNVCKEICSLPFYICYYLSPAKILLLLLLDNRVHIAGLFQYSYEEVIQRLGYEKTKSLAMALNSTFSKSTTHYQSVIVTFILTSN